MRGSGRGAGRPPGYTDWLFAGRSRADKEADQDARIRAMLVMGVVVGLVVLAFNALFTAVGLRFGWWSAPVFGPLFFWLLVSAACDRVLRPVELDELRWGQRLRWAGALAVTLWVVWLWWAGPAARAWKAAHGGFGPLGPRYPLGAVLDASPVAMGLVVFLLLAVGMVLAPRIRRREPRYMPPPAGPEPLPAPSLPHRPSASPRWPDPRRWP
jgi:hypothetical protein